MGGSIFYPVISLSLMFSTILLFPSLFPPHKQWLMAVVAVSSPPVQEVVEHADCSHWHTHLHSHVSCSLMRSSFRAMIFSLVRITTLSRFCSHLERQTSLVVRCMENKLLQHCLLTLGCFVFLLEIPPFILHPIPEEMAHLCPVHAYAEWVVVSEITQGYIFHKIASGDQISEANGPMVGMHLSSHV